MVRGYVEIDIQCTNWQLSRNSFFQCLRGIVILAREFMFLWFGDLSFHVLKKLQVEIVILPEEVFACNW